MILHITRATLEELIADAVADALRVDDMTPTFRAGVPLTHVQPYDRRYQWATDVARRAAGEIEREHEAADNH